MELDTKHQSSKWDRSQDMGRKKPGHHQKGAGTVTSSRGEQERQGVVLKEWQRTPMQLLHEHCMSKKRKNPFYPKVKAAEGKFRTRCVLPDQKDSAKDLAFCPEQSFDTLDEAKHCAALLALHYVGPSLPHERKLPDPYRDLWLQLSQNNSSSSTNKSKSKKKEKKETEAPAATNNMDLWGEVEEEEQVETKKAPLSLSSDRKFASKKEFEQAKLEKTQERNKRNRMRESRERANESKPVFMNATLRERIESMLKSRSATIDDVQEKADVSEEQEEAKKFASTKLKQLGFQQGQIDKGLKACSDNTKQSDDLLDAVIDWLCLHVPEGELPKGFNPEGTQLDVVVASNKQEEMPLVGQKLVQKLMKYGYDRHDCAHVASELVVDVQETELTDSMVLSALQHLHQPLLKHFGVTSDKNGGDMDMDEVEMQRSDELMALEAIFDSFFSSEEGPQGHKLTFELADKTLLLEVWLPQNSTYPMELPVIALSSFKDVHPSVLLSACGNALKHCSSSVGDPILYDLCMAVESEVASAKPCSSPQLVAPKSSKKQVAKPAMTPKPSSSTKKTKKPSRKTTKPALSEAQMQSLSQELLADYKSQLDSPNFVKMQKARSRLPAASFKDHVLSEVEANQVSLVRGQTGCGKTTQVPQFLLEEMIRQEEGGKCDIICTQPRRLAAIGVATRVAEERNEKIGESIGYQIRMESKRSRKTRLLFCTTGVLLRRILHDKELAGVSHLIVDEVHERSLDTDLLLSLLREILPKRRNLKIVLMSATMDASLFVNYFGAVSKTNPPVIEIPGFTYPVTTHFLEDVLGQTGYRPNVAKLNAKKVRKIQEKDASIQSPSHLSPIQTIQCLEDDSQIDYHLCVSLISTLVSDPERFSLQESGKSDGSILVFLPGVMEIKRLQDLLSQNASTASKTWVLPLHGGLSGSDQSRIFQHAPKGSFKVVLSTNIAETSVTIDDVTCVIDTGKVKEMHFSPETKRSMLAENWTSQASCDQRKGRAGRVRPGQCFRLFSSSKFQRFAAQIKAEIHRVSLQQLVLQLLKLELDVFAFLQQSIEPPKEDAVRVAVEELLALSACSGMNDDNTLFTLTPLGHHLALLPLDARVGKVLIFGSILRCVEPVACIAASLSSKPPFLNALSLDEDIKGNQEQLRKELAEDSKSDHLILARLVEKYENEKGRKQRRQFCKQNGLGFETMESIVDLKRDYLNQLEDVGFYNKSKNHALNVNADNARVLKAALCAGLSGQVAKVVYPSAKYTQTTNGVVSKDPDARQLKYFVKSREVESENNPRQKEERVFIHPSSINFKVEKYETPYLVFSDLVETSKVFVRDSSMVSVYSLLLFGGTDVQVEYGKEKTRIWIDKWVRVESVGRVGVLVKAMRKEVDALMEEKIATPELNIGETEVMDVITTLLKSEGL